MKRAGERLCIYIKDRDLVEAMKKFCQKDERTVSSYITKLVKEDLAKKE